MQLKIVGYSTTLNKFADFSHLDCADTSIIRTPSRLELLYTRSQISLAARTFGLEAVDMVCVNYKDAEYLRDECEDGRRLGFNGKVCGMEVWLSRELSYSCTTASDTPKSS